MRDNFELVFDEFRKEGEKNLASLTQNGVLSGRVLPLVPLDNYRVIVKMVNYPSPITKMMFKLGVNPQELVKRTIFNLEKSATNNSHQFYIQSML
jgi:hypothetical protein